MRVRNLNEETQNTCSGSSLLAHWDRFSRQTAYRCFVKGCTNKCSVGGRVQKDASADKNWYIIPLCDDCNKKRGQDLEVWDMARLIPANFARISRVPPAVHPIRSSRVADSLS